MSVSRLKNLIILILVLANLALLALVIPLHREDKRQQELAMTRLQSLFTDFDLSLNRETLPKTLPLYALELTADEGSALPAARALLGEQVLAQDDSPRYLVRYETALGTCQASRGGDFEAQLLGRAAAEDPGEQVQALLTQMQLETASLSLPVRVRAGEYALTATQQLLEVPLFSSQLVFTYDAGVLTQIHGEALFDTKTLARVDETACIGAADALVAFLASRDALGWVGSAVTELTQGYVKADTASAAVVRLLPGWQIGTDTGVFWVNGITREVVAQ